MFEKNLKGGKHLMVNNKGLSNIIATVLIILLALAAVVIVWQFVKPVIEAGGESVTMQSKCLQVEVVPTACNNNTAQGANNVTVLYQLKKGTAYQVVAIVQNSTGLRNTTIASAPGAVFQTASGGVSMAIIGGSGLKAYTAAIVQDPTSGQTLTCAESSTTVICK